MRLDLRPGAVVEYPYLWRWQQERSETEGRKERPVCVLVATRGGNGLTHLALLAISSRPPGTGQSALEVPEVERRRGGLDGSRRAWITTSEFNYDVAERSWYLDSSKPPLGRFSKAFMMRVASEVAPMFRQPGARVDRRE